MGGCGDGSWKGERYFSCKDGHALFIVRNMLKPDRRQKKRSLVGQGKCIYSLMLHYVGLQGVSHVWYGEKYWWGFGIWHLAFGGFQKLHHI